MVKAFDSYYDVDPWDLVQALGMLFGFNKLERRGKEAWCCCPFHSSGEERTPSASFRLDEEKAGAFYCFGCHTRGTLSGILIRLFGRKDKAENWLENNYKTVDIDEKRVVSQILPEVTEDSQEYELASTIFTNYTDYYESRGIPDELVKKFRLGYSKNRNAVILPVFEGEKLVFYQARYLDKNAPIKWYLPKYGKVKIFGKEFIDGPKVYVCESVFNALTFWKFGYQAVALFGARVEDIFDQLLDLGCLCYVISYDGDFAGRKNSKELASLLREKNKLVQVLNLPNKKDVNDFAKLTKEEFDKALESWKSI